MKEAYCYNRVSMFSHSGSWHGELAGARARYELQAPTHDGGHDSQSEASIPSWGPITGRVMDGERHRQE